MMEKKSIKLYTVSITGCQNKKRSLVSEKIILMVGLYKNKPIMFCQSCVCVYIYFITIKIFINSSRQIKDRGIELSYCCGLSHQVNKIFRTSAWGKKRN